MEKATESDAGAISKSENTSSDPKVSVFEIVTGMDREFYRAAMEGITDGFKEKGEEIEFILTPKKNTILHIHLMGHNVSEAFVEEILRMCPALLMKPNAKGETLLHIAARYGYDKIVRKLIESAKFLSDAEAENRLIRATNEKKDTALHEAVCFHHMEIVDILTKRDPCLSNLANSDGETPLYVATEREHWDVVHKILENCISPNQDGPNGRTALHAAVIRGNKEMVSKLLTRASTKQSDENGWVPLHLAALHRSPDLTEVLLDYDRNTAYMRDKRGRTALHFAAFSSNVLTMEKIIKHCADCAELVDEKGYNALHYLADRNQVDIASVEDTVRIIQENPSLSNLYNEKDDNGNTPLHHFASTHAFGSYLLLRRPPTVLDPMAFNRQNQTAIDIAYDNLRPTSSSESKEGYMAKRLREIGARFGGRIIKKEERKKKQEETPDSASAAAERKKKLEDEEDIPKAAERVMNTNMVVATLIATVTFAAGFTMPGGFVQEHDQPDKGSPLLKHKPAFQAFVITDSMAFVLSTAAVLLHIFAVFSPDQYELMGTFVVAAFELTILAMVFMVIAFVTGTYAILAASKALAVVNLLIGLSFFSVFILCGCLVEWIDRKRRYMDNFAKSGRPILNAQRIQLSQSHV